MFQFIKRHGIASLVIVALAMTGVLLLNQSSAATSTVALEPEKGSIASGATVGADAVASGGSFVKFKAPTVPPPVPQSGTPVSINGKLHVCGLQLCNQYSKPIQLRGMSADILTGYGWGPPSRETCINDSSLTALSSDWGADILRVPMYVTYGNYETYPTELTAMAEKISDAAIARGMYVIIDWHVLNPGDPNYHSDWGKTYLSHMAQKYKDTPNVLYEIANEPNGVPWSTIKSYADMMVPMLRSIDPDNIIIIGTPGWSSFGGAAGTSPSDVYNNKVSGSNLMYTFHFYAATHLDYYRTILDQASNQVPVFVTEWGTPTYTGDGANDFPSAQLYIDLMARKKISWTNWTYTDAAQSSSAFIPGTCPNGPWNGNHLKESGAWVRDRILSPVDNFPVN